MSLWLFVLATSGAILCQDRLVPLDSAGTVYAYDHELESILHLFPGTTGFDRANLFVQPDSTFILEVWYTGAMGTFRTRRSLSAEEAFSLRKSVTRGMRFSGLQESGYQQGRARFLTSLAGMTLGFYGWAVPYLLQIEGSGAIGTYLLLGAGSFFIPHAVSKNALISDEEASIYIFGSTDGVAHGLMLHAIAYDKNTTTRGYVTSALIGSLAEAIIGFSLADEASVSSFDFDLVGSAIGLGYAYGFGAADLLEVKSPRSLGLALLGGSTTGGVLGYITAKSGTYSAGDVGVLRATMALGGYLPVAVMGIAHVEGRKSYVAGAMAGGVIGGLLANSMVQNRDFATSQGTYLLLSTGGGGLIGLGIAALAQADGEVTLGLSGAGALLGYGLMLSSFNATSSAANEPTFAFRIMPESKPMPAFPPALLSRTPRPLVGLQVKF